MLRRKTHSKLWLIPVFALTLIPAAAWGAASDGKAESKTEIKVEKDDLEAKELKAITNFWVEKKGLDPSSRLVLHGTFFTDCDFQIRHVDDEEKQYTGYRISDPDGNARKCMQRHREAGDYCGRTIKEEGGKESKVKCVELSKRPEYMKELSVYPRNMKIGLFIEDNDTQKWVDLPNLVVNSNFLHEDQKPEQYLSEATLKERARRQADREKKEQIANLKKYIKECSKRLDGLQTARNACEALQSLNGMSAEDCEKLNAELDRQEWNLTMREFMAANKPEQSSRRSELGTSLASLAAGDEKKAADLALAYTSMADKIVADGKGSPKAFQQAQSLLEEAEGIDGLGDSDEAKLKSRERALDLGRIRSLAQSGAGNTAGFWQEYNSKAKEVSDEVRNACGGGFSGYYAGFGSSGSFGNTGDPAACQSAQQEYMQIQSIPQVAQQAQYEQYMLQARLQQQMQQMQMQQMQMQQQMMSGQMMGGMNNSMGMPFMTSQPMYPQQMGMNNMGMGNMMGMRPAMF